MSRTFRQVTHLYGLSYCEERELVTDMGSYNLIHRSYIWHRIKTPKAWAHAYSILSKEEYGDLRKQRGDVVTKFYLNGSIKKDYRRRAEKKLRAFNKRELQRFKSNAEHEPMIYGKSRSDEYYW